jgi:streptogramin lyase
VARYAAWITSGANYSSHLGNAWGGAAPSRIAQDSTGNIYVLDRFFSWHLPVLLKIAPSGGGPTSSGAGISAVLPMLDNNPTDNDIDTSHNEAADKRILWAKPIGTAPADLGQKGRAVAMDTTGVLWVGVFGTQKYYRVDPATGNMLPPLAGISTPGHSPYGCQVDVNGHLWSVDSQHTLAEIDTTVATYPVTIHPHGGSSGPPVIPNYGTNYSLSIFNDCSTSPPKVKVYLSESSGKTYIRYDAQANAFSNPTSATLKSVAVGVDSNGNVISGDFLTGEVVKTDPSGSVLWSTTTLGTTQPTGEIHGVIIDKFDDIWVVDRIKGQVIKYGSAGNWITTVKVGDQPYTYGNPPPPTCNVTPTPPPGCAQVSGEARCLTTGGYSYAFTVTNNTAGDMSQILLTPLPGATFTLSPQLFNLSSPLHNGQSTTLTTIIGNSKAGDKVCFFVSLMSDKAACCNVQVCATMPQCGVISLTPPPPRSRQLRPGKRRP